MAVVAVVAAVVAIGTAVLGHVLSAKSKREAEKILADAAAKFNIPLPALKEWTAVKLEAKDWDSLPEDFGNKGIRDEAIRRMSEMGSQGGMDAGSRLALEQARRSGAAQEAQGRASVNQEAQRRGLGGSGLVYGQLAAQQAGADRASVGGLQAASDARARALQALSAGGSLAAQAEAQDFDRSARVNASRDAINRYNADMQADAHKYNNALLQQRFTNQANLARSQYQVAQDQANIRAGHGAATQHMWGQIGQAGGMAINTYAANQNTQEKKP